MPHHKKKSVARFLFGGFFLVYYLAPLLAYGEKATRTLVCVGLSMPFGHIGQFISCMFLRIMYATYGL